MPLRHQVPRLVRPARRVEFGLWAPPPPPRVQLGRGPQILCPPPPSPEFQGLLRCLWHFLVTLWQLAAPGDSGGVSDGPHCMQARRPWGRASPVRKRARPRLRLIRRRKWHRPYRAWWPRPSCVPSSPSSGSTASRRHELCIHRPLKSNRKRREQHSIVNRAGMLTDACWVSSCPSPGPLLVHRGSGTLPSAHVVPER